jgi:uncharacterized protein (DUF433 family)
MRTLRCYRCYLAGKSAVKYERITINPDQMGGVPCIRGQRIPVATVVGMMAEGMSEEEILDAYPDLEREDIREALRYAAQATEERTLPLASSS